MGKETQHQGTEINWQLQPVLTGPYYRFLVRNHWLPVPYEKPRRPKPVCALRADEFSQLRSDRRVMEGGWFQWRSVNKWASWIVSDEQRRKGQTFSRSILASAPIRVSRIKLTIHFSPSSCERLRRSERFLQVFMFTKKNHASNEEGWLTQCQFFGVSCNKPRWSNISHCPKSHLWIRSKRNHSQQPPPLASIPFGPPQSQTRYITPWGTRSQDRGIDILRFESL